MKNGNWVPISKAFLRHLPHDRAYSKVEAILSIQCDYDESIPVTVSGYADLWRWSRKKVRSFLSEIGIDVVYAETTTKRQNQKGQIRVQIRDRSGTDKGQITFLDNKVLQVEGNRKGTDKEQIRDRSGNTTRETNTKNNTKKENIYPDWLDLSLWEDFKSYRKHKDRKAMSGQAEKINIRKLKGLIDDGYGQKEIIEETIARNWAGFFPPKEKTTKDRKAQFLKHAKEQDGRA